MFQAVTPIYLCSPKYAFILLNKFAEYASFCLSDCVALLVAVTGASRGYAFVEYETEREMRRAYEVQLSRLGP